MVGSHTSGSSLHPDSALPPKVRNFLKKRPSHDSFQLRPTSPGPIEPPIKPPAPPEVEPPTPVEPPVEEPPKPGEEEEPVVPVEPPKPDPVKILGPGTSADDLGYLVSGYAETSQAFQALLQFPFLDAMINNDSTDPNAPLAKESSLRDLVVAALGEFNLYINNDIGVCRTLIGYAQVIEIMVNKRSVKDFIANIKPVVEGYEKEAAKTIGNQDRVTTNLATYMKSLKVTITTCVAAVKVLADKITLAQKSLDDISIVKELVDILGKVFKVTAEGEGDQAQQLSNILDVTAETLTGDFKKLFQEKARLEKLIASLTKIQKSLNSIVTLLDTLTANLPKTVEASQAVVGVWTYVMTQFKLNADLEDIPDNAQVAKINQAWMRVSEKAVELQNRITGVFARPASVLSVGPNAIAEPMYPKTKAELNLWKLASSAGIDQHSFKTKARILHNKLVSDRVREKHAKKLAEIEALALAGEDPTPEEQFKEAFGPPTKVEETLANLSGAVSGILGKFDVMLQLPFLSSVQIRNPWAAGPTPPPPTTEEGWTSVPSSPVTEEPSAPAVLPHPLKVHSHVYEGVGEELPQIDLASLVTRYRGLYLDLQNRTLPVARNLATYAAAQLIMIPNLTTSATPGAGQIPLSTYTEVNKSLVDEQYAAVDALHLEYLKFKQSWELAIDNLQGAINEAKETIEASAAEIKAKKEELKEKALWAAFEMFGAILLFTAAAFLPGGMLLATAGVGLLSMSIGDLVAVGKLDSAIRELERTVETTKQLQANLEIVLPAMEDIKTAVSNITEVWSQVAQNLLNISNFMGIWTNNPSLFTLFGPAVTASWNTIEDLVNNYSKIISGVTH